MDEYLLHLVSSIIVDDVLATSTDEFKPKEGVEAWGNWDTWFLFDRCLVGSWCPGTCAQRQAPGAEAPGAERLAMCAWRRAAPHVAPTMAWPLLFVYLVMIHIMMQIHNKKATPLFCRYVVDMQHNPDIISITHRYDCLDSATSRYIAGSHHHIDIDTTDL